MRENGESPRWWEFYFVRYGTGTVIGGIIFFFLCLADPVLKPLLLETSGANINGPRLALLAGYGLAYCYVASAPILVFHVGRYLLEASNHTPWSWQRLSVMFVPPFLLSGVFGATVETSTTMLILPAFCLAAVLIWLQAAIIVATVLKRKDLFAFYRKLAKKRSKAKGGMTESYKHMREHGNSFAIVIVEIVLAVLLYAVGVYVKESVSVTEGNGVRSRIVTFSSLAALPVRAAGVLPFTGSRGQVSLCNIHSCVRELFMERRVSFAFPLVSAIGDKCKT